MSGYRKVVVVSDIHYASPGEQSRRGHEARAIANPLLRALVKAYRHLFWMRDPFIWNHLLDRFIARAADADWVVGNGDYSCDTGFVGVSDEWAFASAAECLTKLRQAFPSRFLAAWGDHELGKMSLFGGQGGMRLASWQRAQRDLDLSPFWEVQVGRYTLLGIVSSLVALPVFQPEALPAELPEWQRLRELHLQEIRRAFANLQPDRRVILFCHDPTAIPFLWKEEAVRERLSQLELTVIGHLHTKLILWQGMLLGGMPPVRFLGNSIRRMSTALHEARHWKTFNVRLCPALAGAELLKDGGYCSLRLDWEGQEPAALTYHPIPRSD